MADHRQADSRQLLSGPPVFHGRHADNVNLQLFSVFVVDIIDGE